MSSGQRLLVAMSRLQLAQKWGYVLHDQKLNKVQFLGGCVVFCKRKPQQTFRLFQVRRLCCRKISHREVLRGSTHRQPAGNFFSYKKFPNLQDNFVLKIFPSKGA